jgi:hypothetical protein
MLHLLSQSSRSESVLVGAQAVQTGRKHGDNGDQVPHQFFFWRERLAVHNGNLGSMSLAERFKPVIAKANKPVLLRNDETANLVKFDLHGRPH